MEFSRQEYWSGVPLLSTEEFMLLTCGVGEDYEIAIDGNMQKVKCLIPLLSKREFISHVPAH